MTFTPGTNRGRIKAYYDDLEWVFDRHPVALVVFQFSLSFTVWCLLGLFSTALSAGSYRAQMAEAARFAGFMTIFMFVYHRVRRKRRSSTPGEE